MKSTAHRMFPYGLAVIVSLIFSAMASLHHVPNQDGVLYLMTGRTFLQQGFSAAHQMYVWPFYPILIALTAKFIHLPLLITAYLINSLLIALLVVSFMMLVVELTDRSLIGWAALIILCYTELNNHRYYIIRDFGYWAFFLQTVYWTILFYLSGKWRYAIMMAISVILAALFRVEGIVIAALLPCFALLRPIPWRQRVQAVLMCYGVLIVITLIMVLLGHHWGLINAQRLHGIVDWAQETHHLDHTFIGEHSVQLATLLGPDFPAHYATTVLVGGLLCFWLHLLLDTITLPYVVLIGYAWYARLKLKHTAVILAFLGINLAIVGLFLGVHGFLTSRYVMPMALLLIPYGCLSVAVFAQGHTLPKRYFITLLAVLILLGIGSNLPFGPSQQYLKQAGEWIQYNTPATARIFTNDNRIAFYGNLGWRDSFHNANLIEALPASQRHQYDYFVVELPHAPNALRTEVFASLGSPTVQFENRRGDGAYVFVVKP